MGTNYYWKRYYKGSSGNHYNIMDIQCHIGKRSAAGFYCWDCGTTLNTRGTCVVHNSGFENYWSIRCPSCGKEATKEDLNNSTGGRELGFNKNKYFKKTGVSSCSSFNWTLMKHKWNIEKMIKSKKKIIVDEYDREFTAKEFLKILLECPIEFQNPEEFC